jgi:acetyl esterase/lipase
MSGLAVLYFHGSAWHMLDKDFRTRPMFRHLVSQGHTVMDVSYRLCPEVDIHGMVGDVKRAVAWMKANAARLGVDPDKIVLGGGSAGAHVALLAAYAPDEPELTPDDVKGADLSVCGAYSFYGPTNLLASYVYERQEQMLAYPPVPIADPSYELNMATDIGRIDTLLGGHPKDVPQMYEIASPVNHVGPDCPPTFLALGEQDMLEPMAATGVMYHKLVAAGVSAVFLLLPWTDHGFDLLCPQLSPPAQAALYDFDRFLAILANRD